SAVGRTSARTDSPAARSWRQISPPKPIGPVAPTTRFIGIPPLQVEPTLAQYTERPAATRAAPAILGSQACQQLRWPRTPPPSSRPAAIALAARRYER